MRHVRDTQTLDLFDIPEPANTREGTMDCRRAVCNLLAEIIKNSPLDRHQIACEMSRLEGRTVSKFMLDAWASESREDHNIPFYQVLVLEEVCHSHRLTDWHVSKRGGKVSYGKDVLEGELGKLELIKENAARKIRELKKVLGEEV
ncbi:MAG: hypothetical protein DRQ62_04060 [Gammaproteobacteria bacterium]|nr:MAG: hypothetical protein DRQ62_04060 [Gammaproteobacteria bacterium]